MNKFRKQNNEEMEMEVKKPNPITGFFKKYWGVLVTGVVAGGIGTAFGYKKGYKDGKNTLQINVSEEVVDDLNENTNDDV